MKKRTSMKKKLSILLSAVLISSSVSPGIVTFASEDSGNRLMTNRLKPEKSKYTPFTTIQEDDRFPFPETADKFGQPELTHQVKDIMIPNIVDSILEAFPAFEYLDQSSIAFGLSFINSSAAHFSARMSGGVLYDLVSGSTIPSNYRMLNGLQVNLLHYNTGWNPTQGFKDRGLFEHVMVHEMVHAFTMEALPRGWDGINKDGVFTDEEQFPVWFSEGVADAVAGEMAQSLKFGTLDENTPDHLIEAILKTLPENSLKSVHGVGYYASLYLGHLMSGQDEFSVENTRKGLNKLFESLISGVSFDDILKNYTKYSSLDEFEKRIPKDKTAYEFIKWVLKERNYTREDIRSTGFGGVLTGDFTSQDLVSDEAPASVNPLFKMDPSRGRVLNTYPKEVTVLSGGTKNKPGSKPVVPYTDAEPVKSVKLDIPQNITYNISDNGEVAISWNEVTNASSYFIEVYKNDEKIADAKLEDKTEYSFKADKNGLRSYSFRIKTVGNGVKFKDSDEAEVTIKGFLPTIAGADDVTIKIKDEFDPLQGVTSTDKEDGKISDIKVIGDVDTSKIGTYTLTYMATDSDGNVRTVKRVVTVRSNDKPVIHAPEEIVFKIGELVDVKRGITATDKEDGNITENIQLSGDVDFNKFGKYSVSYHVTDSDGNTAMKYVLISVTAEESFEYLSDRDWRSAQQDWGTTTKDKSVSQRALRLTKEDNSIATYEKGIGTHSNSTIIYDLSGGDYTYFTSYVGVDRAKYNSRGSVTFEVYVDGERAYNSGIMYSIAPQRFVKVDIRNASELKLVVTNGRDGNDSDHATWGNAKLYLEEERVVDKSKLQGLVDKFSEDLQSGRDTSAASDEDWENYVKAFDAAALALVDENIDQKSVDLLVEECIRADNALGL